MGSQVEYVGYEMDEIDEQDEVGGEYLYSKNDPKKTPVSRKYSNVYDSIDTDENVYDEIIYDENDKTRNPNVPTTRPGLSKKSEKKKVTKKQPDGKERPLFTINFTKKRCIFVFILCAIVVIGVGAGVTYIYQQGVSEGIQKARNVTETPNVAGKVKISNSQFEIDIIIVCTIF